MRARGGKRWTEGDDTRLLELASQGKSPTELASMMQRSYFSIQNRLRTLNAGRAKCLPRRSERTRFPSADLSCGALSHASHDVVRTFWSEIKGHHDIIRRREPSTLKPEVECFLGAVVREGLMCLQIGSLPTWRRVSLSQIRASDAGIDSGAARNLIIALNDHGFLELFVGYFGDSGTYRLEAPAARLGRSMLLRATRKTLHVCTLHQINLNNLHTHFPSPR